MKQLHIFLFIISILISGSTLSQETTTTAIKDTLPPAEKYGLRVGTDVSKLIKTAIDDTYSGFEIIADYRVYRNYYIAAEIGKESLLREEENIKTDGTGNYAKIGIDYNVYKNWYGMQNNIFVGLRYGYSSFDQTLNEYTIFSNTNYFGVNRITEKTETKDLSGGWIEFTLGLKVEILNNLYLGVHASLKRIVNEKTPDGFDNLFIPGYGKTNDASDYRVGYGYTISYLIPFFKKKK